VSGGGADRIGGLPVPGQQFGQRVWPGGRSWRHDRDLSSQPGYHAVPEMVRLGKSIPGYFPVRCFGSRFGSPEIPG